MDELCELCECWMYNDPSCCYDCMVYELLYDQWEQGIYYGDYSAYDDYMLEGI